MLRNPNTMKTFKQAKIVSSNKLLLNKKLKNLNFFFFTGIKKYRGNFVCKVKRHEKQNMDKLEVVNADYKVIKNMQIILPYDWQ